LLRPPSGSCHPFFPALTLFLLSLLPLPHHPPLFPLPLHCVHVSTFPSTPLFFFLFPLISLSSFPVFTRFPRALSLPLPLSPRPPLHMFLAHLPPIPLIFCTPSLFFRYCFNVPCSIVHPLISRLYPPCSPFSIVLWCSSFSSPFIFFYSPDFLFSFISFPSPPTSSSSLFFSFHTSHPIAYRFPSSPSPPLLEKNAVAPDCFGRDTIHHYACYLAVFWQKRLRCRRWELNRRRGIVRLEIGGGGSRNVDDQTALRIRVLFSS